MQKKEIIDKLRNFCDENAYNLILDYSDEYEYSMECLGIAFEGSEALALANINKFFQENELGFALTDYQVGSYLLGKIIYFPQIRFIEYTCIGKTKSGMYCVWNKLEDTVQLLDEAQCIILEELGYKIAKKDKFAPGTFARVRGIPVAFTVTKDATKRGLFIAGKEYFNTEEAAAAITYFQYLLDNKASISAKAYLENFKQEVAPKITYYIDGEHCVWGKKDEDTFELIGVDKVAKDKELYDNLPRTLTTEALVARCMTIITSY